MSYTVNREKLQLASGKEVEFEYPILESTEINSIIIVCLDVPPNRKLNENVYALDQAGTLIWQVKPVKHVYENSGPDAEPDGLSFFEKPFMNPNPKPFSVGFKAIYRGQHTQGALGGFAEPELLGIGVIYTPQLANGLPHWSCPVTTENAQTYAERFANAAKRIKKERGNVLPNSNP